MRSKTDCSTFAVPIGLGDPGLAYPLQLDTGSADLILASTSCGNQCPPATDSNPYYDRTRHSHSFVEVNGNQTFWSARFGDGSIARGFVARENVSIASVVLQDQVFGLINSTNLTLQEQKVSGMLGLGFPRMSRIAQALLRGPQSETGAPASSPLGSNVSTSAGPFEAGAPGSEQSSASASQSNTAEESMAPAKRQDSSLSPSPSGTSAAPAAVQPSGVGYAYLPPLLESIFSSSKLPYPVFGLALQAPVYNSTNDTQSVPSNAVAGDRYSLSKGSLTLGGVSEKYVSLNVSTGRTVNDIEWWRVVPFAPLKTSSLPSPDPTASYTTAPAGTYPTSTSQLEEEAYLYWALQLTNIGLNGTGVGLNSSYSSDGVPSIAMLDIGSNGIYGPQQDVAKIFENVLNARQVNTGQWAVPCDTKVTMGFTFGGRYVELQPKDWIYSAVSGSTMCLAWPVASPSTGDGVDWQLGTPFLKNVYTVFSYGINGVQSPQIGFLPLVDTPPSTTNGSTPATPTTMVPASPTMTVGTTLPNHLLTGPNLSTPPYTFSGTLPTGAAQSMGLANASAYTIGPVPVVTLSHLHNASASPNVPDVPGWPINTTEHNAGSASRISMSYVLMVTAALFAAL